MKQSTISILFTPIVLLMAFVMHTSLFGDIDSTKHNLSVSGTGDITATGESEICIFCHTPHNSSPQMPLWNRNNLGQVYTPYTSSTIDGLPGQPTGSSLLCLSCHDGTIALGDLISRDAPIAMTGGLAGRRARLGTDLSDDHPVSIEFTEALAIADGRMHSPSTLTGPVKLDASGMVQCTSCHNPHKDDYGKFLVMNDRTGLLCMSCHDTYHDLNPHQLSSKTYGGPPDNDPWPNTEWTTVGENSCYNCHTPHGGEGLRLLKHTQEEQVCLDCHDGSIPNSDLETPLAKISAHPVSSTSGVHDAGEDTLVTDRHVECRDCHNPHAMRRFGSGGSGGVTGVIRHTRGFSIGGTERDGENGNYNQYQYELCFRCHGDSQPSSQIFTNRLVTEANVRLDFNPLNPSYHPVAASGQNNFVPSLNSDFSAGDMIRCTSCHNNNTTTSPPAGRYGTLFSRGPHGSDYPPILKYQYITDDPNTDPLPYSETGSDYALCYSCHDPASILGDESFPEHNSHITGDYDGGSGDGTSCNVCHDPHGATASGLHDGTKLMNFDIDVVEPNNNELNFQSSGTFAGSCSLSCHNKNHDECTYGSGSSAACN